MRLLAVLLVAGSSLLAQRAAAGGGARGVVAARPSPPVSTGVRRAVGPQQVVRPVVTRTVIAPYPVFYGGGYYAPYPGYYGYGYDVAPVNPGYDPNYNQDPNSNYDPNAQPVPGVVVNRNYNPSAPTPALRDYSNSTLPAPGPDYQTQNPTPNTAQPVVTDGSQLIFLIAMKDHSIFPAVAYWVEGGDTLNYITAQGVHNRATLDLVDRDFSQLLNDQRHVEFGLPPAK